MHKGHVTLLQRAKTMAAQCGAQVALFTFDNNHFRTLGKSTKLLYTFDERLSIYQSLGVQTVFRCTFDEQFRSLSGERFLKSLLAYDICGVVCGADYTCGSDRMGAEQVKAFLKDVCPVEIVPLLQQEGEKVCSSLVRKLLLECRIRQANALLSQPFFFTGKVRHGRNVGEKMGFPTVNIQLDADKMLLQINGTDFPLKFDADLRSGHWKSEGVTKALNAGPLLNLCLNQKTASLMVDSLKFELAAAGFTPDRIRQTLTGTFVTGVSGISVPLELDQSSDLFKLVMLPLENIPQLLGMIGGSDLKNLALEKARGLTAILNGTSALRFSSGALDASFRDGVMTLKDLTLTGDQILAETLLGTVNLANGEIDLKTRTGLDMITIPLNFKGSIASPVPDFPSGIADFLKLNAAAPLQKTVDRLLNRALNVTEEEAEAAADEGNVLNRAVDKGLQKGLRSLDKWLNRRNGK